MRITFFLTSLFVFISSCYVKAQDNNYNAKQPRILILLDESSSMINDWSAGKQRYKAAEEIILKLMDSVYHVNDQVEFSLRAFGEQYPAQDSICYDTRNEVSFSKNNIVQMSLRLDNMQPLGVTPIAYSLEQAADNDLVDEGHYAYSIVLITDGGESCGGDICDVVKKLISHKVFFKPYIVSLVDYAPLKMEYACLGDYLQVTSEHDVTKAVGEIVKAYTPMLQLNNPEYKQVVTTVAANPPSVLKVNIPVVNIPHTQPDTEVAPAKPKAAVTFKNEDTIAQIQMRQRPKPIPALQQSTPEAPKARPVPKATMPKPAPVVAAPPPSLPKVQMAAIIVPNRPHILGSRDEAPAVHKVAVPHIVIPVMKDETPVVAATPPAPKPIAPKPKPTVKKPAPKPTVVAAKKDEPKLDVTTTNIDSKETTFEVYFTDGKGTFYHTTPQVILSDAKTGKEVKRFYRTVDASGNPDPQTDIPPGDYTITVVGRSGGIRGNENVPVKLNNDNKATIIVSNGTLHFQYDDGSEPVDEFSAIVVLRSDNGGPLIKQNCSVDLKYPPGNYFVEVNTLPVERHNVDIDFSATSVITVPRPGFVQFMNQNKLGKISLYCPLGDTYVRFYGLDITGNPPAQKLKLQPGTYQVHYVKDHMPYAQETVKKFTVQSNAVTEITLE